MVRGNQQGNGGWQPVIRRHGGWRCGAKGRKIHGPRWSHKLFFNYGVVTDTFIPNKRRKLTRSRFGFVRYNCFVAADMAVQKANGLWCGDCALRVKMEEFGKYGDAKHRMVYVPQTS
ncbi:hypothetical protein ACSBR1_013986 [Camellia fascicularis]